MSKMIFPTVPSDLIQGPIRDLKVRLLTSDFCMVPPGLFFHCFTQFSHRFPSEFRTVVQCLVLFRSCIFSIFSVCYIFYIGCIFSVSYIFPVHCILLVAPFLFVISFPLPSRCIFSIRCIIFDCCIFSVCKFPVACILSAPFTFFVLCIFTVHCIYSV